MNKKILSFILISGISIILSNNLDATNRECQMPGGPWKANCKNPHLTKIPLTTANDLCRLSADCLNRNDDYENTTSSTWYDNETKHEFRNVNGKLLRYR